MLLPWQFYLAASGDEPASLVTLGFSFPEYLTIAASLGSESSCREEAWRHLLEGVEAIRQANRAGELQEGEWGKARFRGPG